MAQECCRISPDPSPRRGVGSGHETRFPQVPVPPFLPTLPAKVWPRPTSCIPRIKVVMAVSWRKVTTPSLDSQMWKAFIVNGQQYLIKTLFDDQGYYVMVSDLSTVWVEDTRAEELLSRGKVSWFE